MYTLSIRCVYDVYTCCIRCVYVEYTLSIRCVYVVHSKAISALFLFRLSLLLVAMEHAAITRTAAASLFRVVETGVTKRGVVMTLAEREQLCQRLLQYTETIGKPSSKVKALNRVRELFDKLKQKDFNKTLPMEPA